MQAVVEHTLALMYQHLHIATSQSDDVQAVFRQGRPSMSLVAAAGGGIVSSGGGHGGTWVLLDHGCCKTIAGCSAPKEETRLDFRLHC